MVCIYIKGLCDNLVNPQNGLTAFVLVLKMMEQLVNQTPKEKTGLSYAKRFHSRNEVFSFNLWKIVAQMETRLTTLKSLIHQHISPDVTTKRIHNKVACQCCSLPMFIILKPDTSLKMKCFLYLLWS